MPLIRLIEMSRSAAKKPDKVSIKKYFLLKIFTLSTSARILFEGN